MPNSNSPNFRVIIVGAGPVGLYMAHAMEKAGIDYLVLERRATVANPNGQLLLVWPHTARLFDQLGLYGQLMKEAIPMREKKRVYGVNGTITSWNRFWQFMEPSHGYPFVALLRSRILDILCGSLGGRTSKIRTGAELVAVEPQAGGVRVRLADGDTIEGSIVVGTDGVHSRTRQLLTKLQRLEDTTTDEKQDETMVASFHGIFGRAHVADLGIQPATWFESRGAGVLIQGLVDDKGTLTFATIKPLAKPVVRKRISGPRYTESDADEHVASIGGVFLCPGVKFADVWARADRSTCVMVDQEEGILGHNNSSNGIGTGGAWHAAGRVVLVGDSVHKSTSANGLGMTCGVHSAAVLANNLRSLLDAHPDPTSGQLGEVFAAYQAEREAEVRPLWDSGYSMVRAVTRRFAWGAWLYDRFVLPWCDAESFAWGLLPSLFLVRYGQVLSYLPFTGKRGSVPWAHRAAAAAQAA